MGKVITKPNIPNPDDFYARLLAAHDGLSDVESTTLNARMVLILANHIGDTDVLDEALSMAKQPAEAKRRSA
ncbi:DUF2783 domain-containing protein [Tropicibacter naphthalenivorans]|uniref:DUF2783 domain-containing protein n=1 Tax=Tropicibacter naphthalenivorans TaxID=441103 RepID=A0A0N7M184_9RHOB|nr:DUF2783 domain-containing protein [Tropicibacter naphthalenivorans]CUH82553.1 hypothetical protein TRN7648_04095 [Tropicibacter naphthalenivorans]SMD09801.1 Protein of unknown function [Tropicibacter naphthalenivorans]